MRESVDAKIHTAERIRFAALTNCAASAIFRE
jgi:hypothetical protein